MLRERESKDSFDGLWGVHVGSPYQTPSLEFIVKLRQKLRQGLVTKRPLKATERQENLNFCLELTL